MKKVGTHRTERLSAQMQVANEFLRSRGTDVPVAALRRALAGTRIGRWLPLRAAGAEKVLIIDGDLDSFLRDLTTIIARQPWVIGFMGGRPAGKPRSAKRHRRT